MPVPSVTDLAEGWKEEAERLRSRYAAEALARLCEMHAAELQVAITAAEEEELDLDTAAEESRYSKSQLRRIFGPRATIRRGDLPRKARAARPRNDSQNALSGSGVEKGDAISEDVAARLNAQLRRRSG